MEKLIGNLEIISRNLAAVSLLGVVFCVIYQIVLRNFLHIPCDWTEEVARYLMIWMTFTGSIAALKKGEHLMVDLLYNKYPPKVRQWVHLISDVLIAVFCFYLLWFSVIMCTDPRLIRFKSPSAGIPRVIVYAALPVGAAGMLIMALYDVYNTIQIIRGKIEDTTGAYLVDESISMEELDRRNKETGE